MADAIIYSSTDPAGPGVPATGASPMARMFSILHACLVTGYGTKPGQGWVLIDNSDEEGFTLRSPDGVYLCFERSPSLYNVRVYLAEALSPPYTYPPVGVNVRSQDYSADYASTVDSRQFVGIGSSSASYRTMWWSIVARGTQVFVFARTDSLGSSVSAIERRAYCFFIGNLVMKETTRPVNGVQNFVFLGGTANTGTGASSLEFGNFSGGFTRLRDLESGVVETGSLAALNGDPWRYYGGSRVSVPRLPADLALVRTEVTLSGAGAIAYLPGVYYSTPGSFYSPDQMLVALGRESSWAALSEPLNIAGVDYCLIPGPHGLIFISLDEDDW